MSKRPTPAQYDALDRAAERGGVWKHNGSTRADVIDRCIKLGWLTYVGHALSAKGYLAWMEGDPETGKTPSEKSIAVAMKEYEKAAYVDEHYRALVAARQEAERESWRRVKSMSMRLEFNEWFAVMEALAQASSLYRADMHGVVLHELREKIEAEYKEIAKKIEENR